MKKALLILILYLTFFSCSKDTKKNSTIIQPNGTGSVRYNVNGDSFVIDHENLLAGQYTLFYKQRSPFAPIVTWYMLNAQQNAGADNILVFSIVSDSLNLVNYRIDKISYDSNYSRYPLALKYNGQTAGIIFSGDFFDVNITDYQNSRISGSFTAKLTPIANPYIGPPGQPGSIIISGGVFDSVQVIY